MLPEAPAAPTGAQFRLGFAQLKAQLGPIMGDPTEDEHGNPDNCDTQQQTTTGLAYWRCSSNMLTFAALPDGAMHWASAPSGSGLVEWTGTQDPPPDALTVANAEAPTDAQDDPPLDTACIAASPLPATACAAGDTLAAQAAIQNSGDTVSVDVNVPPAGAHLTADLVNLPADYDLYLSDASGTVVDESMQEGTTPEHMDDDLPAGTYYLYVHSDPGRSVDPQDPFRLEVSVS
ncbi:MAG: hypothetical protein JO352_16525 [Chloroflexi bacterium]|nr:hypothetical protein [Chloroflexota bacterium]MBV9595691.1 hypothetical protein [Chloroflexota bacterium]